MIKTDKLVDLESGLAIDVVNVLDKSVDSTIKGNLEVDKTITIKADKPHIDLNGTEDNGKVVKIQEDANTLLVLNDDDSVRLKIPVIDIVEPSEEKVLWNNGGNLGFGKQKAISIQDTNYNMVKDDTVVLGDVHGGNIDITLPKPEVNKRYIIKKVKDDDDDDHTVSVKPNDGEKIDGKDSYDLSALWKYVEVVSDGTDWFVISNN